MLFRRNHDLLDFPADAARQAINLDGIVVGQYPIKVMPSKTAILPVNPTFLPRVSIFNFHHMPRYYMVS